MNKPFFITSAAAALAILLTGPVLGGDEGTPVPKEVKDPAASAPAQEAKTEAMLKQQEEQAEEEGIPAPKEAKEPAASAPAMEAKTEKMLKQQAEQAKEGM